MTRLLLDSHLVLWWLNDDPRLPVAVVERVQDPDAEVFVSQASLWEMAITPWDQLKAQSSRRNPSIRVNSLTL